MSEKCVLISVRPQWCELIANGKKTIEVRKNRPKLETPFKCYIYCTLPPKTELFSHGIIHEYASELIRTQDGKILYGYGMQLACDSRPYTKDNFLCKKVIGEFICDHIERMRYPEDGLVDIVDAQMSRLTAKEIIAYSCGKPLFGWHISALKIYGKPKELSEFHKPYECERDDCCGCTKCRDSLINRAPQSWCYVEALTNE